ncbi:MAG: hypothetical protein KAG66_06535, partial [Methylococcales bacterium]|nr:hypothetical protein [Methylococcales bacterium]
MKSKNIIQLSLLLSILLGSLLIPSTGKQATIQARSLSTIPNNLEPPAPRIATQFNGKDAYIAVGKAKELDLSTFTLEL